MSETTVEVTHIDKWGWECPHCDDWNEEEMQPHAGDELECDGCFGTVVVVEEPTDATD